jgi:hypothetical protein
MGLLDELGWAIPQECDCSVSELCEFCGDGARSIGTTIATRLRAIQAMTNVREREAALEALCVELEGT